MKTGLVESWAENPMEWGPIYPFVSYEIPLFAVCLVIWVLYTVWQVKSEHRTYSEEAADLSSGDSLERVMENNRENR